ncbi:MAG: hypothetical protein KDD47_11840 [Acidobacteria bacterium]|nr:hypothetical protein [Acidobacteriota bacterium]
MNDSQLRRILSRLPRQDASEGFASRVLASVEASPSSVGRRALGLPASRWAWAAGLALALAGAIFLWLRLAALPVPPTSAEHTTTAPLPSQPTDSRAQRIAGLERDRQRLLAEVRELRGLVETAEPALFLGSDGSYDVYLPLEQGRPTQDLRGPRRQPDLSPELRIVPTAWKSY